MQFRYIALCRFSKVPLIYDTIMYCPITEIFFGLSRVNLSIRSFYFLSKGRGEGREGEKGLTQTFLLAYVEHPDSGCCADWIIYNAPRRHTTGN